jgi:FtsH-binding integral membrane protein
MNSPTTMPVSELPAEIRGAFLVRTYSHLALAIALFVGIEVWFFQSGIATTIVKAFDSVSWLVVLGGFMLLSWLATFLANPSISRPLQYVGLVLYVFLQAIITVPLLYIANQTAPGVIGSAAQATPLWLCGCAAGRTAGMSGGWAERAPRRRRRSSCGIA